MAVLTISFAALGLIGIGLLLSRAWPKTNGSSANDRTSKVASEEKVLEGVIPVNKPWTFVGTFKGRLAIAVSGEAILSSKIGALGPEGLSKPASSVYVLPGENVFCALVKYDDRIEKLGKYREFDFKSETDLYFGPNEDPGYEGAGYNDNSGSWSFRITREP